MDLQTSDTDWRSEGAGSTQNKILKETDVVGSEGGIFF
jgi:hypothetical protein